MAGLRQEPRIRVLGIDPRFEGVPAQGDVVLCERQRLTGGNGELQLHEVAAGDEFGDGVLDLQAGIHFQEVRVVAEDEEFDGARIRVADFAAQGHRG